MKAAVRRKRLICQMLRSPRRDLKVLPSLYRKIDPWSRQPPRQPKPIQTMPSGEVLRQIETRRLRHLSPNMAEEPQKAPNLLAMRR